MRIAPTEYAGNVMLRGIVHDPTARRMGGVAGHAGLFTTAADLAKFARMLLRGGAPVFKAETVRAMTSVQTPPNVLVRRAGGFDLDSGYSRTRGTIFPLGSYGHTGFTGTILWIDPYSKTFYVFLSNRVHPNGKGMVTALQVALGTLSAKAARVHEKDALPPRPGAAGPPRRAAGEGARRPGKGAPAPAARRRSRLDHARRRRLERHRHPRRGALRAAARDEARRHHEPHRHRPQRQLDHRSPAQRARRRRPRDLFPRARPLRHRR